MHLAYLQQMRNTDLSAERRHFLKTAGATVLVGGLAPSLAFATDAPAKPSGKGFKGKGHMGMATGEDWIDTFFNGGASEIIHYYADDFVFEDATLFQTISTKYELYRAFLPFNNNGPDSPVGVHQFDVVRYDGGSAKGSKGLARKGVPEGYEASIWAEQSRDTLAGVDLEYDEWAVMQWIWKAKHNADDFLGLKGAKGKTTYARGITFHCYRNRKIVREFTHWNFRAVGVQLGALEAPQIFWKK